ncbi:MAG TPA: 16S rRNA (cytidine(1402)-2'-O)-methyltransferase [Candidatus Levybacteria bacterium]|nr:16S rRNA (cytidine(1402)-2'-O)-methyltransferase [Candidatus Levybacteria bacterium]
MEEPGHLYIVATPIGNLHDATLRALDTLKQCDTVVCEDTRVTGKLLHHFGIKKPMVALNEFNEETVMYEIISQLENGAIVALVSDGGTPLISDPGFLLVRLARKKGITITPIPGPSAVTTALSASGIPSDSFLFLGFLTKNRTKKKKLLSHIKTTISKDFSPTLVLYESPHRIVDTLTVLQETFGDCEIVIARELTKIHEEFKQELLSTLINEYTQKAPKGELTLLLSLKQ